MERVTLVWISNEDGSYMTAVMGITSLVSKIIKTNAFDGDPGSILNYHLGGNLGLIFSEWSSWCAEDMRSRDRYFSFFRQRSKLPLISLYRRGLLLTEVLGDIRHLRRKSTTSYSRTNSIQTPSFKSWIFTNGDAFIKERFCFTSHQGKSIARVISQIDLVAKTARALK